MSRGIYLPAIARTVPVKAYVAAVKKAKTNPAATFPYGLTTWWPVTGEQIVQQFRAEARGRQYRREPIQ